MADLTESTQDAVHSPGPPRVTWREEGTEGDLQGTGWVRGTF